MDVVFYCEIHGRIGSGQLCVLASSNPVHVHLRPLYIHIQSPTCNTKIQLPCLLDIPQCMEPQCCGDGSVFIRLKMDCTKFQGKGGACEEAQQRGASVYNSAAPSSNPMDKTTPSPLSYSRNSLSEQFHETLISQLASARRIACRLCRQQIMEIASPTPTPTPTATTSSPTTEASSSTNSNASNPNTTVAFASAFSVAAWEPEDLAKQIDEAEEGDDVSQRARSRKELDEQGPDTSVSPAPLLFSRVLPLPSEGWYELNESLSCHADHVARHRMTPGPRVCLVGADYFVVASADVNAQVLMKTGVDDEV